MSLQHHPKPRMRQLQRLSQSAIDWGSKDLPVWLCVGCGCFVYDTDPERAYQRWSSRRAQRFIEWQREKLRALTLSPSPAVLAAVRSVSPFVAATFRCTS